MWFSYKYGYTKTGAGVHSGPRKMSLLGPLPKGSACRALSDGWVLQYDHIANLEKTGTLTAENGVELYQAHFHYIGKVGAVEFGYYKSGFTLTSRSWVNIATISPAPRYNMRTTFYIQGASVYLEIDTNAKVKLFNTSNSDITVSEYYFAVPVCL